MTLPSIFCLFIWATCKIFEASSTASSFSLEGSMCQLMDAPPWSSLRQGFASQQTTAEIMLVQTEQSSDNPLCSVCCLKQGFGSNHKPKIDSRTCRSTINLRGFSLVQYPTLKFQGRRDTCRIKETSLMLNALITVGNRTLQVAFLLWVCPARSVNVHNAFCECALQYSLSLCQV